MGEFFTSYNEDLKRKPLTGKELAKILGVVPSVVSERAKKTDSISGKGRFFKVDRSGRTPLFVETDPPPSSSTDDLSRLSGEALRDEHERIKTRLDKLKEESEVKRIQAEQREADAAAFRELAETLVDRLKKTPYWEEIHNMIEDWKNEIEV